MTGHGESRVQDVGLSIVVEVRTLNSRYFKLTVRAGEGFSCWEPRIEALVRQKVRRGTIHVTLRVDREASATDFRLNRDVLSSYIDQLESLRTALNLSETPRLDALLDLPGVISERAANADDLESDWPFVKQAIEGALESLDEMRIQEGRAMAADLQANCRDILTELDEILARAPEVAVAYRTRLTERLEKLLREYDRQIEPADVVREVGIFAERTDISEELVRLRSHLEQFDTLIQTVESNGRKLDFLTQEMFREANTIGSKANDSQIARHVVEIKSRIERVREMVQNVE